MQTFIIVLLAVYAIFLRRAYQKAKADARPEIEFAAALKAAIGKIAKYVLTLFKK